MSKVSIEDLKKCIQCMVSFKIFGKKAKLFMTFLKACQALPNAGGDLFQCTKGCSHVCIDCLAKHAMCSTCNEECYVASRAARNLLSVISKTSSSICLKEYFIDYWPQFAIGFAVWIALKSVLSIWALLFILATTFTGAGIGILVSIQDFEAHKRDTRNPFIEVFQVLILLPTLTGAGLGIGGGIGLSLGLLSSLIFNFWMTENYLAIDLILLSLVILLFWASKQPNFVQFVSRIYQNFQ